VRNIDRILFIGGDARTSSIAETLHKVYSKAEIILYGADCDIPDGCRKSESYKADAENADVVILPLPITRDGEHLIVSGSSEEAEQIALRPFLEGLSSEKLILGGQIPYFYKRLTEECRLICRDYFDSEVVQLRNAVPTAEGALGIAITELPVIISGCPIVVMGYGRCGCALATRLRSLGADVTVAVRRREAQVMADGDGCHGISIRELQTAPPRCRMLFNTIPAPILPLEALMKLPKNCILVELASGKGGILPEDAAKAGLRLIQAPGLPGKTAPETAGIILAETILEWMDDYRGDTICVKN